MCIIAAKPANVEMPNWAILENMFFGNPDGAGFMWAEKGKVHIRKGLMEYSQFYDALTEFMDTHNSYKLPVVIHCRITTHGGTKPENCHPFPVSDSKGMLQKLRLTTDLGVAHNGVITIDVKNGMSDTMTYIASQMAPLKRAMPQFYKNKDCLQMISNAISSRMAILDKNGKLVTIGDFIEDQGVMYSNSSYRHSMWLRDFTWGCSQTDFDGLCNPDKWEMYNGITNYTHKLVSWLDPSLEEYAFDEEGYEIDEAAIDKDGNVYCYDDQYGALVIVPYATTEDAQGNPVKFGASACLIDELIVELN